MRVDRTGKTHCNAIILDATDGDDGRLLEHLRNDPAVEVIDQSDIQASALAQLRPAPDPQLTSEPRRWAYYPWRRTVVGILGPRAYRRVRLDRNRNLITTDEQRQLGTLRIGVIGLSVGHAIAHTLAMQGLCGELRLADFDDLELSNLNRLPATVFDIGVNKATAAARRIAEIDPYLDVRVMSSGLIPETVDDFLDGLDVVVEECDSLDMKALVRETARARRQPVLMATSDRGLVDIERFDLEPGRPIFHGLLGDVDTATLAGLTNREKIPHVLRIIDAASLSARGAASLIEVGHTLSTWPQLAGDVALGASAVAEAVRRIGLGEPLSSGRVRVDIGAALDDLTDPAVQHADPRVDAQWPDVQPDVGPSDIVGVVAEAASRAPSGGNAQPWNIEAGHDAVVVSLAPEHKSVMDVGFRASAVAVGAAVFNAKVAAAAKGVLGPVELAETNGQTPPLRALVRLTDGGDNDPELVRLYPSMTLRETNRHHGTAAALSVESVAVLQTAASREGARLELLAARKDLERAALLFAAADRVRYLTQRLHADMASELRWPGDGSPDSGIDVRTLELDPGDLLTLDILRRPEVMSMLADWDAGAALGADTRVRIAASSALGVVTVPGRTLVDYARGGMAVEAVWVNAQDRGLAVQPISPVFLYAHTDDELREVSPTFAADLHVLRSEFCALAHTAPHEAQVLVLRLAQAPPASVRSRRRAFVRRRPALP